MSDPASSDPSPPSRPAERSGSELVRTGGATLIEAMLAVAGTDVLPAGAATMCSVLGADRVQLRLADRRPLALLPAAVAPPDTPAPEPVTISDTTPGRALTTRRVVRDAALVHVPVGIRGHLLGVLTVHGLPGHVTDGDLVRLSEVYALLLLQAGATTDAVEMCRRVHDYSLNAELQWQLLPPTGLAAPRFGVHAVIEPAPLVTSDLFDYSYDEDRIWLAVLDASGRGVAAAQAADLTLAALRHARRLQVPLHEQAALANQALYDRYHGRTAVQTLLVEIDLSAATARAIRAGSSLLLRHRAGAAQYVTASDDEPLGLLDGSRYHSEPLDLGPGDAVMLASDGAATATDAAGVPYGLDGLARLFDAGRPNLPDLPRQLISALRAHAGGDLAEDATVVVCDWLPRESASA